MITIGLGEYAITDRPFESIKTYALGSCVALVIYCPVTKYTSMAHIVLPENSDAYSINKRKEAYYAKTIVPRMLEFYLKQPKCYRKELVIKLIGGSEAKKKSDFFKVGPRNVAMVKSILDHYKLSYDEDDTLGHFSRSVEIFVNNGEIEIKKSEMII